MNEETYLCLLSKVIRRLVYLTTVIAALKLHDEVVLLGGLLYIHRDVYNVASNLHSCVPLTCFVTLQPPACVPCLALSIFVSFGHVFRDGVFSFLSLG